MTTSSPTRAGARWLRVAAAVVFAGAGILATFTGLRHVSGEPGFVEIAAGGCLCFLAVLALGPLIVPAGITFLGWLPGRLTGPVSRRTFGAVPRAKEPIEPQEATRCETSAAIPAP